VILGSNVADADTARHQRTPVSYVNVMLRSATSSTAATVWLAGAGIILALNGCGFNS
jgi:hypothetical protein